MAAPEPAPAGLYDTRNILAWRAPRRGSVTQPPALRRYLTDELDNILSDENGEPFRDGDIP